MKRALQMLIVAGGMCFLTQALQAADDSTLLPKTVAALQAGEQPVKIMALGDSITGVYLHTGSRRAWSDMVGIGLNQVYPLARIEMINRGASSATTTYGLQSVQGATNQNLQLVIVMFGVNDAGRMTTETYRSNLLQIVQGYQDAGTEVVLCTPTAPPTFDPNYIIEDVNWNADWNYTYKLEKDRKQWVLEMAVLFKNLGYETPKPGTIWTANFCRARRTGDGAVAGEELSSWIPGTFGNTEIFGDMIFEAPVAQASEKATAGSGNPQEKKVVLVKRTNHKLGTDGALDANAWAGVSGIVLGPYQAPLGAQGEVQATAVRLLYDNARLYVRYECLEPHIENMKLKSVGRDGMVWGQDEVEFFLNPERSPRKFLHFMAAPVKDAMYDGRKGYVEDPHDPRYPWEKMKLICAAVKSVGREKNVPVADCNSAFQAVKTNDSRAWLLMMSDEIHPNMRGHKLIAEVVTETITGKRLSLADVPPPWPMIPFTLQLLASNQNVKVIAMPPYDRMIPQALQGINPAAKAEVTAWPIEGQSLADIETWSKRIRDAKPNLVVIALPANLVCATEAETFRTYTDIIQNSITRGRMTWDCVGILPSVAQAKLNENEKKTADLQMEVFKALDMEAITRKAGNASSPEAALAAWFKVQIRPEGK